MTKSARITHADFERATKAAVAASEQLGQAVRVIFRLEQREIEIIIGDRDGGTSIVNLEPNPWDDA